MTIDELLRIIESETYMDTSGANGETTISSFDLETIEILAVLMSAEEYLQCPILQEGTVDEKLAFVEPLMSTTVQGLLDFVLENSKE